jgi:hypothetical protein
MRRTTAIAGMAVALLASGNVYGQAADPPLAFEVASVKAARHLPGLAEGPTGASGDLELQTPACTGVSTLRFLSWHSTRTA